MPPLCRITKFSFFIIPSSLTSSNPLSFFSAYEWCDEAPKQCINVNFIPYGQFFQVWYHSSPNSRFNDGLACLDAICLMSRAIMVTRLLADCLRSAYCQASHFLA